MAVRIAGSAQTYSTTANPPSTGGFSWTCWAQLVVDRNAASGIWAITGGVGANTLYVQTSTDGVTLQLISKNLPIGGPGTTSLFTMTVGTWYRLAMVCDANSDGTFYYGTATGNLTGVSFNKTTYSGITTTNIGCALTSTEYMDGRLAAFKRWNAQITLADVYRELGQYAPANAGGLVGYHPFLGPDTMDWAGAGGTLTGGSGATTEAGPPIPWNSEPTTLIPWDPTSTVWYSVYDTTTGELLSVSSVDPRPLPGGQALRESLVGQPNLSIYDWDVSAREYVLKPGIIPVDRVQDMVNDSALIAAGVWASLTGSESTALQDRIGSLLGPYRYRDPSQPVNLE